MDIFLPVGWKRRSAENGVRIVENEECQCGKRVVWKLRSVENAEFGKCGVQNEEHRK